jgi:hypothetical protein
MLTSPASSSQAAPCMSLSVCVCVFMCACVCVYICNIQYMYTHMLVEHLCPVCIHSKAAEESDMYVYTQTHTSNIHTKYIHTYMACKALEFLENLKPQADAGV